MTADEARAGRGAPWAVIAITVVVGAALQAATAVPGDGTASPTLFALQVVGSFVAMVAWLVLLAWATRALVHRSRLGRPPLTLVLWSVVVLLLAVVVGIAVPLALPVVVVLGLTVLPAAADGERAAWRGLRVFRTSTLRAVVATVVAVVLAALTWVVALVSGFFLTGALGGFVMWLWFGAVAALVLLWWTRIATRSSHGPLPEPATTA
jgi:hypothetical protein